MSKYFYLTTLFLFKASVGSILLLVGWDIIGFSNDSSFNVALITGLAFLPAAFAKPLYNRLGHLTESFVASVSLIISSILVLIELFYITYNLKNIYFFATIHFILWIFIFLIETFLERWFVKISEDLKDVEIRNLSGFSMGLIQIGVISGPVLVWLTKYISFSAPYISTSILLVLSSIPGVVLFRKHRNLLSFSKISSTNSIPIAIEYQGKQLIFVLAFALIWPTVATFNMVVPLLVKTYLRDTISAAVILEAALALGTASVGILLSRFQLAYLNSKKSFIGLFGSIILLIINLNNFVILSLSIFLIGFFYGHLRILSRTKLAKENSSLIAGKIIAASNALSAPLVIIYLLFSYLEFNSLQTISFCGLSFLVSGSIFYLVQKGNSSV